ncbi:MAG: nuclear transport factor 2 family protein [Planctomycetota bacterium]|nr:nuclear transport factor 2 family protein [Planctomycetota bacterium]
MTQVAIEFASETAMREAYARDAVERFYAAHSRMHEGDPQPLADIFAPKGDFALLTPYGGRQIGRPSAEGLLGRIMALKLRSALIPRDLLVRVKGDWAYSVGIERFEDVRGGKPFVEELRATTILRRCGEEYRVIYHHADPSPALQDAIGKTPPEFETPPRPGDTRDVLRACEGFWEAVNKMFAGDIRPMADLWRRDDNVTLLGPCGNVYVGWEAVRAEFQRHTKQKVTGRTGFRDPYIRIEGDVAFASCRECSEDLTMDGQPVTLDQRATTIFVREDGQWRVVHQHCDHVPGMDEPLAKARRPKGA